MKLPPSQIKGILCTLLVLFSLPAIAQQTGDTTRFTQSNWKGFTQVQFTLQQRNAWVVKPQKALKGNPWLWRARFPGYHSEADSLLAAEGFHIAYINTNGMFGNPESMEIWDQFYTYLLESFNLDKKVALAGVSRGGLFIYTWAKRNPQKVHCIYGDAPVCDFNSWPGGFGTGMGSKEAWEQLKVQYGFESDAQAKAYTNNPIDNLEILAREKIPILHMVSLQDQVVPTDENTLVLVNRYLHLGGIATVVPCTRGEQTLHGHHFPIETPRMVADFVKYHCLSENKEEQALRAYFENAAFTYTEITGIGHEKGCTRRDPSDVIQVGDTWYVYYTKVYGRASGYWGTIWCATSKDEGYSWQEQGEVLGLGEKNMFDSQATFTPNILYAHGKYYLYYTGVKPTPGNAKGAFENNSTIDITAIGVAVADKPEGPFTRLSAQPILKVSPEPEKFDSYRVDDAVLLYRNGLYWLYYKGRSSIHGNQGPRQTQMGAAFSKYPEGPFTKLGPSLIVRES